MHCTRRSRIATSSADAVSGLQSAQANLRLRSQVSPLTIPYRHLSLIFKMKKSRKSIVVQHRLRAKSARRGLDCIVKVVSILSKAIKYKFRVLTSDRRYKNWTSRKLKLLLVGPRSRILSKIDIPLVTNQEEVGFVNFWHELTRKSCESKIMEACSKSLINKPNDIRRSRKVLLKAYNLKRIHFQPWKMGFDKQFIRRTSEEMRKLDSPIDPYMPINENQRKILSGQPVNKEKTFKRDGYSFTFTKLRKSSCPVKNMRQTLISDYYFPRSSTKNPGSSS